jgi:hypothetical protein
VLLGLVEHLAIMCEVWSPYRKTKQNNYNKKPVLLNDHKRFFFLAEEIRKWVVLEKASQFCAYHLEGRKEYISKLYSIFKKILTKL